MHTSLIYSSSFRFTSFIILLCLSFSALALKHQFSLVDTQGKKITENELLGQFSLVFFGYRQCVDTCPVSLSIIAQTMASLESNMAEKVQPVFISVDSKRDDAESLRSFAMAFHPKMIALMGTSDEIKRASYNFKVFYSKQLSRDPDNYEISHTSSTYLLGPSGELLTRYEYGTSASVILEDLKKKLGTTSKP